jgi:tripartite motif-containing protein 71
MNVRQLLLTAALVLSCCLITKAQFFFESVIGNPLQVGQIKGAEDVAFDAAGNIYVASGFSHCVMKFSPTGVPLSQIGVGGTGEGQLNNPESIAIDAAGNIYVADAYNSRVVKFNSLGQFQNYLAIAGTGNGQVSGPMGIAIDANGNIFVVDGQNHRVQKFNSAGVYSSQWGSLGTGDTQFSYPAGIAVDTNGDVYVVDAGNHRIMKFNNNGSPITKWGSSGSSDGQFNTPRGIAVDASGDVYVSEQFGHRIQKFNILGQFQGKFGSWGIGNNQFYLAKGLEVDASGNIYVADRANDRVLKFSSSFAPSGTIGTPLGDGQFDHPFGVTTDASGNIYVADAYNHQIQKFNSSGVFITRWGGFGTSGNGTFNVPYDVAIDNIGDVYVVDGLDRVQKFSSTGVFKNQWGGTGSGNTQLNQPRGIAIDASNMVYVVDMNNHRVVKFNSTGGFITKWGTLGIGTSNLKYPEGIAIDGAGDVYVADTGNSRIQVFSNTGAPKTTWGSNGSDNGKFQTPVGISISPAGDIFVSDDNRFQQFSSTGDYMAAYFSYGFGGSQFFGVRGINASSSGNLLVTDVGNGRILKFSVLDIVSISATSGLVGSSLTITGSGFSTTPSENVVKVNGTTAIVTATSATSLTAIVPTGATTGKVSVTRAGFTAQSTSEFLVLPLSVTSFTPSVGSAGANVVVNGTGFSSIAANNEVKFNGITSEVTSSTPTSLIAKIPAGNTVGKITVRVNGVTAASANDFSGVLSFTSFTPNKALAGASVTITGTGFSSTPANQLVQFNGVTATVTASTSTSLTITVPVGATTGKLSVIREGTTVLSTTEFLALPLSITSFTPGIGIVGAPITISGTGFSTVNANNSVSFNGSTATVTSSTATTINTLVPLTSTNGKILVTVNGVTATSVLDFTITKLAITQSNYPQFFVDGDAGAAVRLTVNDINEVLSAKVYWRGITQDEGALSSASIPHTISSNEVQVSVPASFFIDPLGLFLKISLVDKSGNEITGTHHNIYMKYPTTSTTQVIPNLKFGKKANSYQLIAIPLELTTKSTTSVFADLGNYDTKKWRLFSYDGSIRENPASISTGQGYWFIMSNTHEINPGEGNVVKVTQGDPYKISLRADWNLIGNPYNFNISWEDVLEHNGLNETQLKFRQFLNGGFSEDTSLKRFRGGFVHSDIARDIEIPVINKGGSGRKAAKDPSALDTDNWLVKLNLQDGEFSNSLLGFGMHPQANEGKDIWD